MAKKISLMIYGLSVINNNNKRICLNQVTDNKSLIDIIKDYIDNNISKYTPDTTKETLFQFDTAEVKNIINDDKQRIFQILYGRVKTGEYGIESELVDIHTGDITNRTTNQADMMPFGFCIAVPCGDVDSAVIILQTLGVYGMKTSLQRHLEKSISDLSSDLHLLMRAIAPKEYIDRYFKKGILTKIKMTRYEIPEDESNRLGINYGVSQTKEERIIHKPLGFMEKKKKVFSDVFAGQKSYTDIIQIEGFEYDDLKLEFALEGTNKTFNMKDMNSLVVNENITNKVRLKGGHPTFDSLKSIMKKTAKEYLEGMGLIV